jgi:hypothetical protein
MSRKAVRAVVAIIGCLAAASCADQDISSGGATKDASAGCDARHVYTKSRPFEHELRMPQPGGFLKSPATDTYIASIADPIRAAYGFPAGEPHIYVVPTEAFVAQAMVENDIFISVGTLELAGSSDVVAGYLAHEMGHLACHHPAHNQLWDVADWGLKAGLLAAEIGGAGWTQALGGNLQAAVYLSGNLGVASSGAAEWAFTHAGWSRGQETKADLIGTEMLIRAHQRTNGLIVALSALPSNGGAAHDGSANDSSAFSGSDHPGANARIDAINDYVSRVHADYHDPAPHDEQRQAWQNAVHNAMRGLDDVLKAQQALAQPLALVGHPEYTGDEVRNATALGFVRLAFSAPRWQPEQDLPRQDDPEMVALADLTLTKIVVAELRLRLAPHVFDADDLRQRIFARPDMPEQYALLNALGFMISKNWQDAGDVVMNASHTIGRTRLNDLWGMAAASSGGDTASQNMYVIDCTFSADQAFMKECDDAQKNPAPMIDGWWQEARELPPLPILPVAEFTTGVRHRGGAHHASRKRAATVPADVPGVPANLSEEAIARKPPVTDDDIRKTWLKP